MNNKNLAKDGEKTRFSKDRQPGNAGRKPSRLKKFIKEYDVSPQDVNILLTNLIFNYSLDEIKEIAGNFPNAGNNLPVGIAAFVSGLLHDVTHGDMRAISLILDRVYGKAVQEIAHSGDITIGLPPAPEEAEFVD